MTNICGRHIGKRYASNATPGTGIGVESATHLLVKQRFMYTIAVTQSEDARFLGI